MKTAAKPYILFDLGDTLMIHEAPWTNVLVRASKKMEAFALRSGFIPITTPLARSFLARLKDYYARREEDQLEGSTYNLLRDLMTEELGIRIDPPELRGLLGVFYEHTRSNWYADPDGLNVLQELSKRGYTLALLSNAADHDDVIKLVEGFGFMPYFKFILTSADIGYRKPHPAIFIAATQKLGCSPDQVTMIGDRLDADIQGALDFGASAVWLRRDLSDYPLAGERNFHIVRALNDLLNFFPPLP